MSTLTHVRAALVLALLIVFGSADAARAQGALTNGQNHTGLITAGDSDSWTFTATAGSTILLRMSEIGGDSDLFPYLQLYGPNAALLASGASTVVAAVAATAAQNGTYTVVATTNDSGQDASGDYRLTLALVPGTVFVPPGDEGGPATNGLRHAGQIHVGDLDQWTLTVPAGATILARVGEVGGDSDLYPYVLLYGPNGQLLDSGANPIVATAGIVSAPTTGAYTLVVTTNDGGHDGEGDYLLTTAVIPGTPQVSPGDEGGALTNGLNAPGAIDEGDLDQWTFTATAGATILARVGEVGGDSELHPHLLLYGPNGQLLDAGANPLVATVAYASAPTTGTYTLVVTTNDGGNNGTGDYLLNLALVPGSPQVSPGDQGGDTINGLNHAGEIHTGDMDQWTFTAPAGATILARVGEVGGDSELYPYLLLYGPNGALLSSAANPVVATAGIASAPTTGTYTLVVTTNDGGHDGAGDYLLNLALIPGAPQVSGEVGGGPIVNGLNHAGEIHTGDMDQWTFNAAAGSTILARVGEVGGDSELYPYLLLYGPNGQLLDAGANPVVATAGIVSAPLTGTYTLVVTTNDGGYDGTGDYLVNLALIPGSPQISPGDQGGAMTNGLNHAGEIHAGDMDQWTFTATAGATILARVGEVGGDSELYPYLLLYGPNGALLSAGANPVVGTVGIASAPTTGTYTLVVTTNDGGHDGTGDYLLNLAVMPGAPQLSGESGGGPITNGLNHPGEIHTGDIDQWTFSVTAGSTIVARAGEVGGDSDLYPYLLLYGPNGQLLDSAAAPVVAAVGITSAPQTGVYTLVVTTNDGGHDGTGDYLVTAAIVPGTPQLSPGDHGGLLTNNVPSMGEIHVGDLDQWRFRATAGNTVRVTLSETGGDSVFLPHVALYGPDGALLNSEYGSITATFQRVAPMTGLYTLVVTTIDGGNDATGAYQLLATGIDPPPPPDPDPTDLWLTMSASASPAAPCETGGSVSYTLTVGNRGPANAGGVVVTDVLPAGLSPVSCSAPGGACSSSGNTVTATFSQMNVGSSQTVTIVANVMATGGSVANSATVAALNAETAPVDNTDGATFPVVNDSLPGEWERMFGINPCVTTGEDGDDGDPDHDGRTNLQELNEGTHPRGFFSRYLAEGARNVFFQVRFAVINVGSSEGRLWFRFLQPGGVPRTRYVPLPPLRRITIDESVLAQLGIDSPDFSTVLESDQPVVMDRTMTWANGMGSHAETGVPQPRSTWYLAEGATAGDFSLFYLLQNPSSTATVATVKYLLPDGLAPITRTYDLAANSRMTIFVDIEDPQLAETAVSAVITTPTSVPIIVERAMYRNTTGQTFAAGHGSTGVVEPSTHWFLAEGATGPFFDCFILLANPSPQPANVDIVYLLDDGRTFTKRYVVPRESRYTVYVDNEEIPAGSGVRPLETVAVSSTVTSDQPIIVERAMWWPGPGMGGEVWSEAHNSAGATVTGTRWALADGEIGGAEAAQTYVLIANTSATAGLARVTLYFTDGTSAEQTFPLLPNSRRNVAIATDFPTLATPTFSTVVESLPAGGNPAAQIVVERAMYTSPGGHQWAAGTNALATRLNP